MMFNWRNFGTLILVVTVLAACSRTYDVYEGGDVYEAEAVDVNYTDTVDANTDTSCSPNDSAAAYDVNAGPYFEAESARVNVAGQKFCSPRRRCPDDGRLPPKPCAQPMPTYYGNASLSETDGIVLIHPYTRTQVVCFDQPTYSASECAQNFRLKGYVLITDLPQLPARYDFLRDGTYPTRRWRDGGEVVPRW